MKFYLCIIFFASLVDLLYAQSDTNTLSLPSNSYEEIYKTQYPDLKYFYNNTSQTHDYSDNWDFDNDGINDKILFIGNGAVHLYFYLQIHLSAHKQTLSFPFLMIDFPFYTKELKLDKNGKVDMTQQFIVANFDKDKSPEIYISLNEKHTIPRKWKRKGIFSHQVIINYSKGKLELINYK